LSNSGSNVVYVGGSNVTSSNGAAIAATSGTLTVQLFAGDQLYAVCASAQTSTLTVLQT